MDLTIEVEGVEEVALMFDLTGQKAQDMRPTFSSVGDLMLKAFDMNFDSHGNEFGSPWKPRLKAYPWPMLEQTGRMKQGFDRRYGADYVELYNEEPYFKYHQSSKARTTRLPRRIMMKIDQKRLDMIIKEFQNYIMGEK